jgi:Ca2+-binding EF-hand superfamily protein
MSQLIDQTFSFIDKLLNGNITLREMDYIKTVFHDKNINVREEEVKKLFANRHIVNHNIATAKPN